MNTINPLSPNDPPASPPARFGGHRRYSAHSPRTRASFALRRFAFDRSSDRTVVEPVALDLMEIPAHERRAS